MINPRSLAHSTSNDVVPRPSSQTVLHCDLMRRDDVLRLDGRVSPALVKVVAAPTGVVGPGGRQLLQPSVFKEGGDGKGDAERVAGVASASSWAVSSWMEKERFGLVSELSPDNFNRYGTIIHTSKRGGELKPRASGSRTLPCLG